MTKQSKHGRFPGSCTPKLPLAVSSCPAKGGIAENFSGQREHGRWAVGMGRNLRAAGGSHLTKLHLANRDTDLRQIAGLNVADWTA